MAIDSIGSNALTQQLPSTSSSVAGAGRDADGDNDNSGAVGRAAGGSPVASAIAQALTSIGVTAPRGTDASGAVAAGSDPQQAAHAFTQALFAALHDQDQGAGGSGVAHAGGAHHRHGGGAGKVESGLQNLIQQLGASGSSAKDGASTPASTSGNGALSTLQSAFDSLVSANGGQPGSASLGSFLQAIQQNLHAAPASGNVVNTSA